MEEELFMTCHMMFIQKEPGWKGLTETVSSKTLPSEGHFSGLFFE